ncbi:MAG TPA: adenylate/guanylate cyclase domain-containing protein [Gaiellaceae bacterium]|nr:adenylate/guanylate cyclase domain-containing protein [Gaiellaceae bacterium]
MASGAHRKVVTVLFCDVVGSTALGESVDPEALQGLLARYFERMKEIVESHGGTVEKFIGDAVMAVFGVPVAHEDDALRACRAALEMRDALPELGVEGRIGVNTGEVLTGTEERLATGDAVNVAARLEQAAEAGEVLIGGETLALVGPSVDAGEDRLLELKGKSAPVPAYPLLSIRGVEERTHASRFVGRERESEQLADAWNRALHDLRCELFTVVGDPGVGKSRLVAEAFAGIDARIVRGRCLSYGEGITYWPVVEVVKQLDALPGDEQAARAIESLLGESETMVGTDEIAWAFRKLLEEHAPLVVCFDDIQWAEETFLDLIESTALLSTGAPLLLLCMARPELLDRRPGWPATLRLEPLPAKEVGELVGDAIPEEVRARIVQASGGNPLFVTEMVALAGQDGDVEVPATLRALLAARLDQLDEAERKVLERGAVEGELFHRGTVQALTPEETEVTSRLAALVRRELVRPDQPQLPRDDAYRFRHLLIRDAAYDALPKATRAELHRRFSDWLEERGTDLVELDEILGYHLEQASRYRTELGQPDSGLAERAGSRLAAAGRRALLRGDQRAAAILLDRALALLRPARLDIMLELDRAEAQLTASQSAAVAEAAAERARQEGDLAGEAVARVTAALNRMFAGEVEVDELDGLAHAALPLLEEARDHQGLAHVWHALAYGVANMRGRFEDAARAAEQAHTHWRLADVRRSDPGALDMALTVGPRPADEALEALDAAMPESPHPIWLGFSAWLLGMQGRLEEAETLGAEASERALELTGRYGTTDWTRAEVAALAGDHDRAAHHLERMCGYQEAEGMVAMLSTFAPRLGLELCELGRFDEAETLALKGRELGEEYDAYTQALWRQVLARVGAHRGEFAEGERLAHEAVAVIDGTDSLIFQAAAREALAEVLEASGRLSEARKALEEALERYKRKSHVVLAERTRERLASLPA